MSESQSASGVLRAAAVVALLIGLVLMSGTWDWLYETLDLPQSVPALTAQLGGLGLAGLAYVLWAGSSRPELAPIAAGAGAIAQGGGAVVIAAWLIFRDQRHLGIGDLGNVILIVAAVVLALLALAQARLALGSSLNTSR